MDKEKELEHEIMESETILANKKEKLERLKFIHANRRYYLNWDGSIHEITPTMNDTTKESGIKQGNVFKTAEYAEKERDRRALLYEFNQFCDKCNNGWTPVKNREDCQRAIEIFGKEIIELFVEA